MLDVRKFGNPVYHSPSSSAGAGKCEVSAQCNQLRAQASTYLFDLSDFEDGRFTATRFHLPEVCLRPHSPSAWVCVARSDKEAFARAIEAAIAEWPLPHTRSPEQFTVRFVDAPLARSFEPFDRRL